MDNGAIAVRTLPGLASGGGIGESVLKRGWICASDLFVATEFDRALGRGVGLSDLGGSSVTGSEGKGPSRGLAGEAGREAGIGVSLDG